jgi:hypothetical protein
MAESGSSSVGELASAKESYASGLFDAHVVDFIYRKHETEIKRIKFQLPYVDISMDERLIMENAISQERLCVAAGVEEDESLNSALNRCVKDLTCSSGNLPSFLGTVLKRVKILQYFQNLTEDERQHQSKRYKARRKAAPTIALEPLSEFNLRMLSSLTKIHAGGNCDRKPLRSVCNWLKKFSEEKGALSLFSEWSPPMDSERKLVTVQALSSGIDRSTIVLPYSAPGKISENLPLHLCVPGKWKASQKELPGMVFVPARNRVKSEVVVRVKGSEPVAIKSMEFFFTSELPESISVQVSSDGTSWFRVYTLQKPYITRKTVVSLEGNMLTHVKLECKHTADPNRKTHYLPVGICNFQLWGSTDRPCTSNRRRIISDIHTWLSEICSTNRNTESNSDAIKALMMLVRLGGSFCTVLHLVKACIKSGTNPLYSQTPVTEEDGAWSSFFKDIRRHWDTVSSTVLNEIRAKGREPRSEIKLRIAEIQGDTSECTVIEYLMAMLCETTELFDIWPLENDLQVADLDLEVPFCIEGCVETFYLCNQFLIDPALASGGFQDKFKQDTFKEQILTLLNASFRRIRISMVNPASVGFEANCLQDLANTLSRITADASLPKSIQLKAAGAFSEGFECIYSSEAKRVSVLTQVLKDNEELELDQLSPGKQQLIANMLKRFKGGIVNSLPQANKFCTEEDARKHAGPLATLFNFSVDGTVDLLTGASLKPNTDLQDSALKLLMDYQRHLMALFSRESSRYTAPSRVTIIYGELLCQHAQVILKTAKSAKLSRVDLDAALQKSIIRQLLPSFVMEACLNFHLLWLSKMLVPHLVDTIKQLDALNVSLPHIKNAEKTFYTNNSSDIDKEHNPTEKFANGTSPPRFSTKLFKVEKSRPVDNTAKQFLDVIEDDHDILTTNDQQTVTSNTSGVVTVFSSSGVSHGLHAWEFNINSASIYIGVCHYISAVSYAGVEDQQSCWAVNVKDGSLWYGGQKVGQLDYEGKAGDIICMKLDTESGTLSYFANGVFLGNGFEGSTKVERVTNTENPIHLVVTMEDKGSEISVRGAGYSGGTACLPYLLDLEKTIVSCTSLFASSLVSGVPNTTLELEMDPWLASPLFSAGLKEHELNEQFSVEVHHTGELGIMFEESITESQGEDFVAVVRGFRRVGSELNERSFLEKCGLVHPGHVLTKISSSVSVHSNFLSLNDVYRAIREASRPLKLFFSVPKLDLVSTSSKETGDSAWEELIDPDSQRSYFWNKATNVTQWDKPADTMLEDSVTTMLEKPGKFLLKVSSTNKILEWVNFQDKKVGMDRMIYKNKVLLKRLGAFPKMERKYLAAILWQSGLWALLRDHLNGKVFESDENSKDFKKNISEIAANVRIFRGWLRSQKSIDWSERSQIIAEEENAPVFTDEKSESAFKQRRSSNLSGTWSNLSDIFDEGIGAVETKEETRSFSAERKLSGSHVAETVGSDNYSTRAMVRAPRSFEELCRHVEERCSFILSLNSANFNDDLTPGLAGNLYANNVAQTLGLANTSMGVVSDEDIASDEQGKANEQKSPLQIACLAVSNYAQHGAIAAPTLVRLLINIRTARVLQRVEGLNYFADLIGNINISSAVVDCLLPLRRSLAGVFRTDSQSVSADIATPSSQIEYLSMTIKRKHHYMKNVDGCSTRAIGDLKKTFDFLFSLIVNVYKEQTNDGYSRNPALSQIVLDTLCLDYQSRDHKMLLSSGLLHHLRNTFSVVTRNRMSEAWFGRHSTSWNPEKSYSTKTAVELNDWKPWPPHIVRQALQSGYLTIREVICKIRETPREYLNPQFWESSNLLGSLSEAVSHHTISSVLEAYDRSLREAMESIWEDHLRLKKTEATKAAIMVQSMYRRRQATRRVEMMKQGEINASLRTGFSDYVLQGTGHEMRQLRRGAWAFFRFLATLLVGGVRDSEHSQIDSNMDQFSNTEAPSDEIIVSKSRRMSSKIFSLSAINDSIDLQKEIFDILESEFLISVDIFTRKDCKECEFVEAMEAESYVYSHLLFYTSVVRAKHIKIYLSKMEVLTAMCQLLFAGSPRIIGLTLGILKNILHCIDPLDMNKAFGQAGNRLQPGAMEMGMPTDKFNGNSFVSFLVWRSASIISHGSGLTCTHSIFDSIFKGIREAWSTGAGSGYVLARLSCECLSLLKEMTNWGKWTDTVRDFVYHILSRFSADGVLSVGSTYEDVEKSTLAGYAAVALGVMGGISDMLRIGGKVRVNGHENTEARTILYTRGMANALIVLKESVSAPPQLVPADSLIPTFDVLPKEGVFELKDGGDLVAAFRKLIAIKNKKIRRLSLMDGLISNKNINNQCHLLYLRSCAINALSFLLGHGPSAIVARDTKILSEMFAVALQPLDLSTFVTPERLSQRFRLLQEWGYEVMSKEGSSMLLKGESKVSLGNPREAKDHPSPVRENVQRDVMPRQSVEHLSLRTDIDNAVPSTRNVSQNVAKNRKVMDTAVDVWSMNETVYSLRLCIKAVKLTERNGEYDSHRASEWLKTEEAAKVKLTLSLEQTETSYEISNRWERASELSQVGASVKLCYHALELFGDDPVKAGDWLLMNGMPRYSKLDYYNASVENKPEDNDNPKSWACHKCTFLNEDLEAKECLLCTTPRKEEKVQKSPSAKPPFVKKNRFEGAWPGYEFKTGNEGLGYYLGSNYTSLPSENTAIPEGDAVVLSSINDEAEPLVLESSEENWAKGSKSIATKVMESLSTNESSIDDNSTTSDQVKLEHICTPVWKGMMLIVSDSIGHEKLVSGRPGVVVDVVTKKNKLRGGYKELESVKLEMLDQFTGVKTTRVYPVDRLKRPVQLFGGAMLGKFTVLNLLQSTADSLSSLFARKVILSTVLDLDQAFSVDDLGGPKNLVSLMKYVAATDDSFMEESLGKTKKMNNKSTLNKLRQRFNDILSAQALDDTLSSTQTLDDCLVSECIWNIRECTSPLSSNSDEENVVVRESLHPCWPRCTYTGEVSIDGAAAIRIEFDKEYTDEIWQHPQVELTFFTEKSCRVPIKKFNIRNAPRSFIIESKRVFYKFSSFYMDEKAISRNDSFRYKGFKFEASAVRGWGMWINEDQVTNIPSLNWALWLMAFLMGLDDAISAKIHEGELVGNLTEYLKTPSAPYKDRIVVLLTQLCQCPWLFDERPNLEIFDGVSEAVMARAEREHATHLFLPHSLPSLVELCMTINMTKLSFATNSNYKREPMNPKIDQGIPLDPPLELEEHRCMEYLSMLDRDTKPSREVIFADLINLVSCMSMNARLPDHLALCVFLHSRGTRYNTNTHRTRVERMVRSLSTWTPEMDAQLVHLLNNKMKRKGMNPLKCQPSELQISSAELRNYTKLQALNDLNIRQRFALLKLLNYFIDGLMAWIDFKNSAQPWSISAKLQKLSHTIFFVVKEKFLRSALDMTWGHEQGSGLKVCLDQLDSDKSERLGLSNPHKSKNLFIQLHSQLHAVSVFKLRSKLKTKNERGVQALFEVQYVLGEGLDYGGLYRDAMNTIVDQLFSKTFSLFILTPNGKSHDGLNQTNYLPNPQCTTRECIKMFETVGKIMGISLRTEGFFPFKFPLLVYKLLITDSISMSDVASIDHREESRPNENKFSMVDKIKRCPTEDSFEALPSTLCFEFLNCSGKKVPLFLGGEKKKVTWKNRSKYYHLYTQERVHEFDVQVDAIRRGLSCIVPFRALQYLTPSELEIAICGDADIDIDFWKAHTRYTGPGFSANSALAKRFWRVMGTLSHEQRVAFIKFSWGRSRLPSRNAREKWEFKLTTTNAKTSSLPIVHTCFFQVELPSYSSDSVMRTKIVTAIEYGLGAMMNK